MTVDVERMRRHLVSAGRDDAHPRWEGVNDVRRAEGARLRVERDAAWAAGGTRLCRLGLHRQRHEWEPSDDGFWQYLVQRCQRCGKRAWGSEG